MQHLQQNWEAIAAEANMVKHRVPVSKAVRDQAFSSDFSVDHEITRFWVRGWTGDPGWLNFGLVYLGQIIPYGKELCPVTMEVLKEVNKVHPITVAGFSWLRPKTGIPVHTDPALEYTTVHLGLDVPPDCALFTGGMPIEERNGRLIRFNSNKPHSAVNASDQDRLVLYLLLDKDTF